MYSALVHRVFGLLASLVDASTSLRKPKKIPRFVVKITSNTLILGSNRVRTCVSLGNERNRFFVRVYQQTLRKKSGTPFDTNSYVRGGIRILPIILHYIIVCNRGSLI